MSDETNTYGDDIHLTTTDATTIYNTLIAALEKGAGEPLYPGDERRIFGEGLVAVFVALYNSLDDTGRQTLLRYARGEVLDAIGERLDVHRLEGSPAKTTMRFSVSTPQPNNIIIPKWTKVTPDSDHYGYTPIPLAEASCIIAHLFVELAPPCSCCKREDGVIVIQGTAYDGTGARITIKGEEVRYYGKQRTLAAIRAGQCRPPALRP